MIYITAGTLRPGRYEYPRVLNHRSAMISATIAGTAVSMAYPNPLSPFPGHGKGERGLGQSYSFGNLGSQKTVSKTATIAIAEPKKNGADAPNPCQSATPCHRMPAINDAGNAMIPTAVL